MHINADSLRQVLIDQQKDAHKIRNEGKSRQCIQLLQERITQSQLIKVVMGIRRAGKSTLCLRALPKNYAFTYINFDDERLTGLTTSDLNQIYETLLELQPNTQIFIFDEIQNIESWELFISRLHRKKINLMITGSNGKLLSRDLATHLTGRHLSLELMPLSFREFLEFTSQPNKTKKIETENQTTEEKAHLKSQLQLYFEIGGFPEVVLGENHGPYLRELFDKIISRDIAQRYHLRAVTSLKELGLYLTQQSGSMTSLEKIKTAFEISSVNTVRSYLEYLKETFLFYEVRGYSSKLKERSTRPRKLYTCDLGMWSALNTKPTPDLGMKLETLVFLHLRRLTDQIFYLKESDMDVDFCILKGRKIGFLIQVAYSMENEKTEKRELRSLVHAAQKYKLLESYIVTMDEERLITEEGILIRVLPAWKFLLLDLSLYTTG